MSELIALPLHATLVLAGLVCVVSPVHGQEPDKQPATQPATQPAVQPETKPTTPRQDPTAVGDTPAAALAGKILERFKDSGITMDMAAGTVTVDAVVNEPMDPVEFLLIHPRGKDHESLFITAVQPSLLNAALLVAGFKPGKNVDYEEVKPPPTEEEVLAGAVFFTVIPPTGDPVYMTIEFKDERGVEIELAIEQVLMDRRTWINVTAVDWVFVGGRMAKAYVNEPPVFVADLEGNLITTCYKRPDNQLFTMRHLRGSDDQNWWITEACPKPGTLVRFKFHRQEPDVRVAWRKEMKALGFDGPGDKPRVDTLPVEGPKSTPEERGAGGGSPFGGESPVGGGAHGGAGNSPASEPASRPASRPGSGNQR